MRQIILHERSWVEDAVQNATLGSNTFDTIRKYASYLYERGCAQKDIIRRIEEFMLQCDPSINLIKWQDCIESVAKNAAKYQLIDIDGVNLTKNEMDMIGNLESKMHRKLMFTLLCTAKYMNIRSDKNDSWVNAKPNEIFRMSNVAVTNVRQNLMISDLANLGYIGYGRAVDNTNLRVLIIDDSSEVVLTVDDFRNLGNQYLRFAGENYFECQCCGLVVRRSSNSQKFCKNCADRTVRNSMTGNENGAAA